MVQVSNVQKELTSDISKYASFLKENGYSYIPADFYRQKNYRRRSPQITAYI